MKAMLSTPLSLLLICTGCQSALLTGLTTRDKAKPLLTGHSAGNGAETTAAGGGLGQLPPPSQTANGTRAGGNRDVAENLRLGEAEIQQGQLDAARQHFEQVLRADAHHPTAHHRLAVIADLEQQYAIAEQHYEAALNSDPGNAAIIGDLGYCYLLQEKYAQAELILQRARQLDPNHKNAAKNLGYLFAKTGDYDKARAMFNESLPPEEAERVLAELFPSGRPGDGTMLAKLGLTDEPPDKTAEILKMMEQARAETARREQAMQPPPGGPPFSSPPAGFGPDPRLNGAPPLAAIPGRVPDARLNAALANIDRDGIRPAQGPLYVAGPNSPPIDSGRFPAGAPAMVANPPAGMSQPGAAPRFPQLGYDHVAAASAVPVAPVGNPPRQGAAAEVIAPTSSVDAWPPRASSPSPSAIQQAGGVETGGQAMNFDRGEYLDGANTAGTVDHAHHQQSQAGFQNVVQQVGGQEGSLVPGLLPAAPGMHGVGSTQAAAPPSTWNGGAPSPAGGPASNSWNEATRQAAALGLGVGAGQMFPVMPTLAPQSWSGSGSHWNGAMYPPPERQLPTTPRPADLSQAHTIQAGADFGTGANQLGQGMPASYAPAAQAQQYGALPLGSAPAFGSDSARQGLPVDPLQGFEDQRRQIDAQYNALRTQVRQNASAGLIPSPSGGLANMPAASQQWPERPAMTVPEPPGSRLPGGASPTSPPPYPGAPASPSGTAPVTTTQYSGPQYSTPQYPPRQFATPQYSSPNVVVPEAYPRGGVAPAIQPSQRDADGASGPVYSETPSYYGPQIIPGNR